MRIKAAVWIAGMMLLLVAPAANAHHSVSMYDMEHPSTYKGVVNRIEWTNPHAYVYLDVKNEKGERRGMGHGNQQPELSPAQRMDQHHGETRRHHHVHGRSRQERREDHALHLRNARRRPRPPLLTLIDGLDRSQNSD